MGIVIRQSFYSSISAYIGVGIGYVNAIILMPLFMEPDQIGLMRAVMSIALLLTTFSSFGTGGMLIRYFHLEGSTTIALNRLFTFGLVIIGIASGIVTLLFLVFRNSFFNFFNENAPEVGQYLFLIILMLFQMTVFSHFEAVSKSQRQIILPNAIRDVLYKGLHLMSILCLGYSLISFQSYMISHVLIYLTLILSLSIPVIVKFNLQLDFTLLQNIKKGVEMLRYGLVSILTGLAMMIVIQIDQIMVTKYLGLSANGIYSIAIFMAIVIELPHRFITQISAPILSELVSKNKINEIDSLYKKASINQLIIGSLIFLLIAINLDEIYILMPNGLKYAPGKWVFMTIGMVKLIDMMFSLNGEIISLTKFYKLNLYFLGFLAVLAIITNLIFIPLFGMVGASLATMLSYLLFNLAKFVFLRKVYKINPFTWSTLSVICIAVSIAVPVHLFIGFQNEFLDIFISSAITSMLYTYLVYYFDISSDFNNLIVKFYNNVSGFVKGHRK